MNDSIKIAINKFLNEYKDKDFFLGAILTGSYATNNQNENSDIDLYIISKDGTPWKERGNKEVDGYLIEYFINPPKEIRKYMKNEKKDYRLSTTNILGRGIILIDPTGDIKKLQEEAQEILAGGLEELEENTYKINCYRVWDNFDELDSKYKKREDIDLSYYMFIREVTTSYFQNNKVPLIPIHKLEYILLDPEYKKKYGVVKFVDDEFANLLIKCLSEKEYDKKYQCAKEIYDYFIYKNNDFNINDFSMRTELEEELK